MPNACNTALPNLGIGDCKLQFGEVKRVLFTSLKKEDGSLNYISKSNAALITNWQTKFDEYNFESNVLEKIVPTDIIYQFAPEQADSENFDEGGYFKKLQDGNYMLSFMLNEVVAGYVKNMKEMEDNTLAVYFLDDKTQVWGKNTTDNIYPIPLQNIDVQNFNIPSRETISQERIQMRVETPSDMNELTYVQVLDSSGDVASYNNDDNWYSLIDVTSTITSPATTGCQAVLAEERYPDVELSGVVHGEITFYLSSAGTTVSLAGAGSLSESPDGTYTINEADLLTGGNTYKLRIRKSGYDVAEEDVVVPS